jgi:chemotaxis protein CheD
MNAIPELLASFATKTELPKLNEAEGGLPVYLNAGHLYVSATPARITTILGSCVAMCVWDAMTGIGGMNHYMLPQDFGINCDTPRYARTAIEQLFAQLAAAGASRSRLQSKLFGGACVMASFQSGGLDLGSRNVDVAREYLAAARIPIVAEDVGGTHGRKLVFRTDTGLAMVRKVAR